MNQKERLVESLDNIFQNELGANFNTEITEKIADYLLADGWMRLPCKIGDYIEWDNGISKKLWQVKGFCIDSCVGLRYVLDICQPMVTHHAIKRIIPREDAEKALKG